MSTRSLNLFTFDGRTLITYNHSDGYPSWAGRHALDFVNSLLHGQRRDLALAQLREINEVDEGETPTAEQFAALQQYANTGVSTGEDWYATLRQTQGLPQAILDSGHITSIGRGRDGFDIEWAYEVDFDRNLFLVYSGDATGDPLATYHFDNLPTHEALIALENED